MFLAPDRALLECKRIENLAQLEALFLHICLDFMYFKA